ncbi:hypothetical protein Naga_100288g5 [Nannochloropsis gaditana]|uniref:Uncharacterized protein n=1 Tax=Nannochloropsis gaditana TaxID=72520 RepID=W7TLB2_9STRA|nr:hypothetical protein Naga_100288g5 [Nannochloropsis gaditana]
MDDTGNTTSQSHTPSDPPASPSGSETALSLPSQKPKLVVLHPPTSSEPSTAAADTLQGGPMPLLKVAKTATNDVTNAAAEGGKKGEEIPKLKIASFARPLAGSSVKPSTSTSSIPIKLTVVAPPPAGTSRPVSSVGAETAARNDASGNPPGGREGGRGQSAAIYPLASEASMPPPGRPAKEEMRENVKAEEVEEEDDPDVMDAEEGEGLEDAEMAQAVAGEEPVLLQEEGAVEAYAEARSEQQKQLEELKLKARI